jgi:dihydrofolate synthase/folylpolyglutamate synthase
MGRWQILQQSPMMVADTGHNVNGIAYILAQLKQQKYTILHIVIGMVKDKDITKVLNLLPKTATYYFTKANIPRALNENELQASAASFDLKGKTYPSVMEAVNAAKAAAAADDFIFIGGSTFVVGEAV